MNSLIYMGKYQFVYLLTCTLPFSERFLLWKILVQHSENERTSDKMGMDYTYKGLTFCKIINYNNFNIAMAVYLSTQICIYQGI